LVVFFKIGVNREIGLIAAFLMRSVFIDRNIH